MEQKLDINFYHKKHGKRVSEVNRASRKHKSRMHNSYSCLSRGYLYDFFASARCATLQQYKFYKFLPVYFRVYIIIYGLRLNIGRTIEKSPVKKVARSWRVERCIAQQDKKLAIERQLKYSRSFWLRNGRIRILLFSHQPKNWNWYVKEDQSSTFHIVSKYEFSCKKIRIRYNHAKMNEYGTWHR